MKSSTRHPKRGRPDKKIVADIVRRIVEAAQPEKIILFGSAARGEMGPNSDYDFLVIKQGKFAALRLTTDIYRRLRDTNGAVDIVVASTNDIKRYGDSPCLVFYPALKEGKVVYEAEALSADRSTRMAGASQKQSPS